MIWKLFSIFLTCVSSQYLEIKWQRRPVYVSKSISSEHKEGILHAMQQVGLEETEDKEVNHIRVEYDRFNGGGIQMFAATDLDGFYVYSTTIGINRLLDKNSFQCIALHELGHSLGLGHNPNSLVMSPVLNNSKNYCSLSYVEHIMLWSNLNSQD